MAPFRTDPAMNRLMLFLVLAMGLAVAALLFSVGQVPGSITPDHPVGQVLRDCAGVDCDPS
jgi:hypothetical protein